MSNLSEEIINRYLTGQCSEEELIEVNAWMKESEENARQLAAAAESVEDVVIRKLAVDKLHTALMQLTKEERDFICALFFDEKTESEVAKGLGVSQQAVHKRKNRILKKLKNFFE